MFRRLSLIAAIAATTATLLAPVRPSLAAEEVSITVDSEQLLNIPVTELEGYVATGEASGDLETLLTLISDDLEQEFQDALGLKIKVKPQPFSQFLNSNLGNLVLDEVEDVIKPGDTSVSSIDALKTAMNQASTSETGFSLVDIIKAYPTSQVILEKQAVDQKVEVLESLGTDVGLLLASFGVNVDVSNAKFDFATISGFVDSASNYFSDIEAFAKANGLTQLDLDSPTPPTGTITLQKAEIHRLYQKLLGLRDQAKQVVQESGIEVKVTP